MLEFDDIQHILLTRAPAITGRYEFLSFKDAAGARKWLSGILGKVHSAAEARASVESDQRWVTVAFTWNGLRALGVPQEHLDTFPEEFREGMAARAAILGDVGKDAPATWVGGLGSDELHAIDGERYLSSERFEEVHVVRIREAIRLVRHNGEDSHRPLGCDERDVDSLRRGDCL